jgi:hypothetical protein
MSCLFCITGTDFNTVEHIIPEAMGNDDLILKGEGCDFFSHIENYVLRKTPIGFWRTFLGVKTKKRRLPSVDFTKKDFTSGIYSDSHKNHDNVGYIAHEDFTVELVIPDSLHNYINDKGEGHINYVITPKVIFELSRFLGKIGLELLCSQDSDYARSDKFNPIRKYVRQGSQKELWTLFHATVGKIEDLFLYEKVDEGLKEDVICYSYSLMKIKEYLVFNLVVGVDSWLICLNDMYPTPIIKKGFPNQDMKLMWYSKEELDNRKVR